MQLTLLLQFIVAMGLAAYLAGIVYLGIKGIGVPTSQLESFMIPLQSFVTTAASALSTFVGMVLGFRQANRAPANAGNNAPAVTQLSKPQAIAAWMYVLSLLVAVIFWAWNGFDSTHGSTVIQGLGKSFVGLIVGGLAVYVNAQHQN